MAVLMAVFIVVPTVSAQVAGPSDGAAPVVAREYLDEVRRLEGNTLRLCVHSGGLTERLDKAVARAIGETLLLDVEIIEVSTAIQIPGLDFIPISEDELFVYLTNDCKAFMGFTLASGVYDNWLTITQPYVATGFVAVTDDRSVSRLSELAPGAVLGTVMLSEADVQLGAYVRSLSETRRWRRFPYPHTPLLVERVVDGTVAVGVGWEPAVMFAESLYEVSLERVTVDVVRIPERSIGLVLRSDEQFLREAIDAAISALIASGDLATTYEQAGFPGRLPDRP